MAAILLDLVALLKPSKFERTQMSEATSIPPCSDRSLFRLNPPILVAGARIDQGTETV